MFDFSNYSSKSKYYDDSNKLVIGKMEDETWGIAIEEFVGLKPKIYSFLVDNNEYKKGKGLNKDVVATIGHHEYKDLSLKNIGWWQNIYSKQWTWQISSWILELIINKKQKKNGYLNNYSKKFFCQAYCFNFQSNQASFFVRHIKFEKRKALKKKKRNKWRINGCSVTSQ